MLGKDRSMQKQIKITKPTNKIATLWRFVDNMNDRVWEHAKMESASIFQNIFPWECPITRRYEAKWRIDAKLYKIVVQFAEVSNFSEVPLQSGLNSSKFTRKEKPDGIILASR